MSDALSEILFRARAEAAVFSLAEFTAPWGAKSMQTRDAIFHVIIRGGGWAMLEDGTRQAFRSGDIVLFPHGSAHVMGDATDSEARPIRELAQEARQCSLDAVDDGELPRIVYGGGGAETFILCGTIAFGQVAREVLLPFLPKLLHVDGADHAAAWMDGTMRLLADELGSERPGARLMAARLADMLVVQCLRAWLTRNPETSGWLAALGDKQMSRALDAIHRAPEHPWDVKALAQLSGMSRSTFYPRFQSLVGHSPSGYLTHWRMVLARQLLRESGRDVASVAREVGYESETAFSRAFKRETGAAPGQWRQSALAAA